MQEEEKESNEMEKKSKQGAFGTKHGVNFSFKGGNLIAQELPAEMRLLKAQELPPRLRLDFAAVSHGKNLFGNELINERVSSVFGDELILGSFLIKTLPIIIWFIFYFKFKIDDNILFLTFFFSLYLITIYLSGGRTSFGLMFILIILLIFFIKPFKKILSYSLTLSKKKALIGVKF